MKKILIVEDDKGIQETVAEILSIAGYQVLTANNGKEGYENILENRPDLVLCDVNMKGLDGFELLSAINQRLSDGIVPPFIFLTAKVEAQDIRNGMRLGADDYILKPFDHMHLLEMIKIRLEKREKLLNAKSSSMPSFNKHFNKLAIPCDEGLILMPFEEVVKCQAERAYCKFHLVNGKTILVSKAMKEFEDLLLSNNFVKVHKSTIVNMAYVSKYLRGKGGQLIMTDGTLVPVAVRKKEELMGVLRN